MKELFETISSFIDKCAKFIEVLFDSIKQSVAEVKLWFDFIPVELVSCLSIVIIIFVVYKILGR